MKRILLSLLLALPIVGYAQETSAPSDDFESSLFSDSAAFPGSQDAQAMAGAGSPSLDAETTEYLVGGTIAIRSDATLSGGADGLTTRSELSGKVFGKVSIPDFGALYVAYLVSHPLLQAYSGDGAAPTADDAFAPDYALSELHYSFDIGKRLFVRIGNQLLAWGPSRIWTPVDFINLEKGDAFAALDARVGKPGLRLHAPLKAGNVFLFADFSDLAFDGTYGDPLRDTRLGARVDFTAGAFEFGLSAFGGMELPARLGFDLTGRLFASTIYAELAVAPSWVTWDAEMQAAFGFSKALGDLKRWTLSAEAFWNSPGSDLSGYSITDLAELPADSLIPLYQGRYYVYGALNASEFLSPSLASTLSVISNLDDGSFSLEFSETFTFPRAVPFSLALAWAGGGAEREFTRYAGNGSLSLKLMTRAEF